MKNFKKVLACIMAVATLGSVTCLSVSAEDEKSFGELFIYTNTDAEWYESNSIKEAVFIVEDGEYSTTYYYDSSISNKENDYCPVPIPVDDDFDTSSVENVIKISASSIDDTRGYLETGKGYRYDESILDGCNEEEKEHLYYQFDMETGDVSLFYLGNDEELKEKVATIEVEKYEYPVAYFVTENNTTYSKLSYNFYAHKWFNSVNLEGTNNGISKEYLGIDTTTIGDSEQTIGDSNVTSLRGDINLDGDVNGLDLLYLKKYLLGLIEW